MENLTYDRCLRCNRAKASGESLIRLKGDWVYFRCGKNNFARRITCFNVNCSSKSKRPLSHAVKEENKPQEPGPSKTETLDDGAAKRIKLGNYVAQECVTVKSTRYSYNLKTHLATCLSTRGKQTTMSKEDIIEEHFFSILNNKICSDILKIPNNYDLEQLTRKRFFVLIWKIMEISRTICHF